MMAVMGVVCFVVYLLVVAVSSLIYLSELLFDTTKYVEEKKEGSIFTRTVEVPMPWSERRNRFAGKFKVTLIWPLYVLSRRFWRKINESIF